MLCKHVLLGRMCHPIGDVEIDSFFFLLYLLSCYRFCDLFVEIVGKLGTKVSNPSVCW